MKKYKKKVDTFKYPYIRDLIDERFSTSAEDWAKYLVVIHETLRNKVGYYSSGSEVHSNTTTLQRGEGDCQDQSVLAANLYLSCYFEVKLVSLSHIDKDSGHVLPLVNPDDVFWNDPGEMADEIRKAHDDLFSYRPDSIAWETTKGEPYFLADPEWSDYVGDVDSLVGDYVDDSGSNWKFHRVKAEKIFS